MRRPQLLLRQVPPRPHPPSTPSREFPRRAGRAVRRALSATARPDSGTAELPLSQGEIDLILRDGDILVFVEVRLRSRSDFGGAAASIDRHKQQRLIRTAQHYLSSLPQVPSCRFDAMLLQEPDGNGEVEWLINAFEA